MIANAPGSRFLAGQKTWILSDGKAGHEAQCLGVVEALGVDAEIRRVDPSGIYKLVAPWGPVPAKDRPESAGSVLAPPWPVLAIATGRTTIPYLRALRRRAGLQTYTVILMDPRTNPGSADLIWVPEHDRRRGSNVIATATAPHRFSPSRLSALRATMPPEIAALPRPRIACLIGGPNGDYKYSDDDQRRLATAIAALAASGAGLMITPSRRTPPTLASIIKRTAANAGALYWDGGGRNPYPDFLAHADMFLITADSVSMACEAAATGKPIHIFTPSGGSAKFRRFHASLAKSGAARPLPNDLASLADWSYQPVHSAEVIAQEIERRWRRRAELLPGLVLHDR